MIRHRLIVTGMAAWRRAERAILRHKKVAVREAQRAEQILRRALLRGRR